MVEFFSPVVSRLKAAGLRTGLSSTAGPSVITKSSHSVDEIAACLSVDDVVNTSGSNQEPCAAS